MASQLHQDQQNPITASRDALNCGPFPISLNQTALNPTLTNANLLWDADGLPHSVDYDDIYYSKADALGESTHVFIHGNDLPARFARLQHQHFVVGELGFGSGLNFLNCCQQWCDSAPPAATLHYLACELHPFTLTDMQRLLTRFPQLARYRDALLQLYPDHTAGVHQLVLRLPQHRICLTLLFGDANSMLANYGQQFPFSVDAWFLDGFSPRLNPQLWHAGLMQRLAQLSHAGTTVASYSVAGGLRSALKDAGFVCEKRKGFAGTGFTSKRHMLAAVLPGLPLLPQPANRSVCIIGGGLSGCSTAYALAETGWQVTVLERSGTLAPAGSGNLQGVLHCKPGAADSVDNQFNLHAYLFAQRHYAALQPLGLEWHQCGMLHVGVDAEQLRRFERIGNSGRFDQQIMQQVDAAQASALAGIELSRACLYFPLSGWLSPSALCQFYSQHAAITVHTGVTASALQQGADNRWSITTANGSSMSADCVVLCNAADVYEFEQCRRLPIICNRGQVDVYESTPATMIRTVLCGQGYLTPSTGGRQSLGGSYFVEATSAEQNRQTHLRLLSRMDAAMAEQLAVQRPLQQRVAERCQTPDRMPLAGLILSDAPGLYINAAHGSNGLARTPISAAWLASRMNNTPAPLADTLGNLLDPARF